MKKRKSSSLKNKLILSIETSCDETALALVKCSETLKSPKFKVLENIVSSQIAIHRPFGGVVPNLAKREHIKNLPKLYKQLVKKHRGVEKKIDAIAVTVGPGLEPALWAGITFARELSTTLKKPLIGANHMEGHIYSTLLPSKNPKSEARNTKQYLNSNVKNSKRFGFRYSNLEFPAILLLVSGGHTILLHMTAINKWTNLGETLDDAAGEAFDKVARILELPYPGGPEIQKISAKGNPNAIKFPRPMLNKPGYEFSFSGLKTSVLYFHRDNPDAKKEDIAASFQQATIDVLTKKTMRAAEEFNAKSILLCGGVSANKPLQNTLRKLAEDSGRNFVVPDFEFNTDNAAMIAVAAYLGELSKKKYKMAAQGNLTI